MFAIYLIFSVLFMTFPMGIIAFQSDICKQNNWWKIFNIPKTWCLDAVLVGTLLLMIQLVGFSLLMNLITFANQMNNHY